VAREQAWSGVTHGLARSELSSRAGPNPYYGAGHLSKVRPDVPPFIQRQETEAETRRTAAVNSVRISTGKTYKTALGRNIDILRVECGLSFDQLEDETAISKSLILRHVNHGTRPHPGNLKLYADTFTRILDRRITTTDLTGENGTGTAPK